MTRQAPEWKLGNGVRGVTVDLWGTLLQDRKSSLALQRSRVSILTRISKRELLSVSAEEWDSILVDERKFFRTAEIEGEQLSPNTRLQRLFCKAARTRNPNIVSETLACFDECALLYLPEVDWGLVKAIRSWRRAGVRLAVVSNTGFIGANITREILKLLGLSRFFDGLVLSEEQRNCKPNPAIFMQASRLLDVKPNRLLHIGDDPIMDMQGACCAEYKDQMLVGRYLVEQRADSNEPIHAADLS